MHSGFAAGETWDDDRLQQWKAWVQEPAQKAFLKAHLEADIPALLLRYSQDEAKKLLLQQLSAHQQIRKKLPGWYARFTLMLPPRLHLEQASSEAMAELKAQIIAQAGGALTDLTGGSGVDFWKMAPHAHQAHLLEPHAPLAHLTQHNLTELGVPGQVTVQTAEDWLGQKGAVQELIYLDPSRRKAGQRQVHLDDYEPRLRRWEQVLVRRGKRIWVKLSPLLDLTWLEKNLHYLHSLHVLAYRNECKEILVELRENPSPPRRHAWHLDSDKPLQHQEQKRENQAGPLLSPPQRYLYEPNVALRKAGLSDQVAGTYGLAKLHPQTLLYTSAENVASYPGRQWEVIAQHTPGSKALRKGKYNVVSRNFPLAAQEIIRQWKLKPHKNRFLIATQNAEKKYWLEAIWRNGPPETK